MPVVGGDLGGGGGGAGQREAGPNHGQHHHIPSSKSLSVPMSQPHDGMGEPRRHSTSGVVPHAGNNGLQDPGVEPQQQQRPLHIFPHNSSSRRPEDVLNSLKDVEKNEIVKRSKKMAAQSVDLFDFIQGGLYPRDPSQLTTRRVKTTQDFFTLAEFFAEEANLLYKVIRLFSYDVPTGEDKRSLMAIADNVPKHCHQLQMLIQSITVGKAATFTKVDCIIKETRQIMHLIVNVVRMCFNNANKYNLDFSHVTLEGRGGADGGDSGAFGSAGGSSSGTDTS